MGTLAYLHVRHSDVARPPTHWVRTYVYEITTLDEPNGTRVYANSANISSALEATDKRQAFEMHERRFWRCAMQQMYADGWRRAPDYDIAGDYNSDDERVLAFVKV